MASPWLERPMAANTMSVAKSPATRAATRLKGGNKPQGDGRTQQLQVC
jgi:hypothetical protein